MKFSWRIHGGRRDEEEEEEPSPPENLTPPKGVSESFCACMDSLKWSLYETIVMQPELETPDAQKNQLLETYETLLEKLHELLTGELKGTFSESGLRVFPETLRGSIQACVRKLHEMRRGGGGLERYTDRIPYHDYLQTQLRTYPYLQYRGRSVDDSM